MGQDLKGKRKKALVFRDKLCLGNASMFYVFYEHRRSSRSMSELESLSVSQLPSYEEALKTEDGEMRHSDLV